VIEIRLPGNEPMLDAINDRGQVLGESWSSRRGSEYFLWSNGSVTRLGLYARALSARGQVVGSCDLAGKDPQGRAYFHACLLHAGRMSDLGTLGGERSTAWAINRAGGRIVGWSETKGGNRHAVLWAPRS
jgi:probable HAF family extracellular repeat protein